MSDFLSIVEAVQLGKNFLAVPHVNLDGDELGCMLALYWGLKKINKTITLFTPDNIPFVYTFLPGVEKIQKTLPDKKFDAALALECSSLERIPANINLKRIAKRVINIDHHPDNLMYADFNYIDSRASALGEIIFKLLKELGVELDYNIAVNLYVSILTDSGAFQYSNTTSETHKIVSKLLEFPLNVNEINRKIYKETEFNTLKLMGVVLATLNQAQKGKIIWAYLTQKMLQDCLCYEENTQYFIDTINTIRDAEITILFKETANGSIKISLRSNIHPVNDLAGIFGGGGHKQAAGCTINSPLETAIKTLIAKTEEMFYR